MYIYIYILYYIYTYYTYSHSKMRKELSKAQSYISYVQSPYSHYGFQGFLLEHNLNLKGWNSQAHRDFSGKCKSSNVSRDHVSRDIWRIRYAIISTTCVSELR